MTPNTPSRSEKHILYCNCSGDRIASETRQAVESALKNAGVPVTMLSDLCGIAAKQPEKLQGLAAPGTETLVAGCYKRTMDLLFRHAGIADYPGASAHLNLIETNSSQALEQIAAFTEGADGSSSYTEITEGSDWPSWYPVIDPLRCTNCGQCADFCLFGVYEKSDSFPRVVHPQGCKNNCPACARICPSTAIIFPKYKDGGAIGGSENINEQAEQVRQAQDIEHFLGDDLYEALERRKARRKSIIREHAMTRAMAEREQALETKPLH